MEKGLISVDRWAEGSQAYFLTNLHTDHTQGLSSTWAMAPIFCSRVTAKLFPFKFPNFNLSLLRVLDLGSWHSLSLISPSTGSKVTVQVMAIDAYHCPGAVMFLFRGEFGCMLNTGDFRWEKNCERAKLAKEMLLNALKDDAVDVLYLDNTYCNPTFQFPTREVAAKQQDADIISSHPDHDIVVGIDTLGKEDLLLHISNALNVKVKKVSPFYLWAVRAIPHYSFSINTSEGLNRMHPTIGIIPFGLPWVVKPFEGNGKLFDSLLTSGYNRSKVKSVKRFHKYVYSVQYSGHSSYLEIEEFIKLVQPTSMKGIVSSSSCNVDPFYYFGRICGINQPSPKLDNEHQTFGRGGYTGIEKKRKRVGRLGFYLSRVTVMRQGRKGIKLDEN
ncbi:hypothetical protein V6Z12_A11G254500 [Gossypium hirsutum]